MGCLLFSWFRRRRRWPPTRTGIYSKLNLPNKFPNSSSIHSFFYLIILVVSHSSLTDSKPTPKFPPKSSTNLLDQTPTMATSASASPGQVIYIALSRVISSFFLSFFLGKCGLGVFGFIWLDSSKHFYDFGLWSIHSDDFYF